MTKKLKQLGIVRFESIEDFLINRHNIVEIKKVVKKAIRYGFELEIWQALTKLANYKAERIETMLNLYSDWKEWEFKVDDELDKRLAIKILNDKTPKTINQLLDKLEIKVDRDKLEKIYKKAKKTIEIESLISNVEEYQNLTFKKRIFNNNKLYFLFENNKQEKIKYDIEELEVKGSTALNVF